MRFRRFRHRRTSSPSRSRFCIAVPVDVVWPQFVAVAVIGVLFFGLAILRFRAVVAQAV
jgi:hypothetical protein